ncbi:MAG: RNA polymerase sigma factor [Bacillota bacterium]
MENLAEFIARHQDSLFAFLYRMCGDRDLAEELMQETFVRALRAAARYRPEGSVQNWLFRIAANLVRDRWRRRARQGEAVGLEDLPLVAPEATEERALAGVAAGEVRRALLSLPLEQRSALILRYYHDLSYEEIAEVLACPIGTVRSRIHNGLERLRRLLAPEAAEVVKR